MKDYIVEGNTVREIERDYSQPFKKPVSSTVKKNREKAAHMNVGYVAFLLFMAGVLFVVCTAYINLRNEIIEKQKSVESLQSKVAALKLEND
ncbi:MAG: cell division protein FtsL, partial [Lachnospiraceae bacterium]|nr:cell division protein FtsL [Lachnospiraceae bacterium]